MYLAFLVLMRTEAPATDLTQSSSSGDQTTAASTLFDLNAAAASTALFCLMMLTSIMLRPPMSNIHNKKVWLGVASATAIFLPERSATDLMPLRTTIASPPRDQSAWNKNRTFSPKPPDSVGKASMVTHMRSTLFPRNAAREAAKSSISLKFTQMPSLR